MFHKHGLLNSTHPSPTPLQLPAHHHQHRLLLFPFWWTTSRSSSLSTTRRRLSEHDISIPGTSRCGTSFESYKFEFAISAPSTTRLISSPRLSRVLSFHATEIFLGWRITPPFDLFLQRSIPMHTCIPERHLCRRGVRVCELCRTVGWVPGRYL